MNKITFLSFILLLFIFCTAQSQQRVTEIFTDYEGYWQSSSTSINPIRPENSHDLLGFRYDGVNYSTGVNDNKLDQENVTYTASNFRALPFNSLPTSGGNSYFVGLGQLFDGIDNGVQNNSSEPFPSNLNGQELTRFLTNGVRGLNLGSGFANIPTSNDFVFKLSASGINPAALDGAPDILVSQIASPSNTPDKARFVDSAGNIVGNEVSFDLSNNTNFPVVGRWLVDFYRLNSTQNQGSFIKTQRDIRFQALDISDFGIDVNNITDAVALEYTFSGNSDPAFISYNEESLSVARQLSVIAQPTESNCDGSMASSFEVQIQDFNGQVVEQAGYAVTASIETGPGGLLGTVTRTTDVNGIATFDDLVFEIGDFHTIRFENTSMEPGISNTVNLVGTCIDSEWTGSVSTEWNNAANWSTNEIPNANFNVLIPSGLTNYPILQANAGAKDLTMQDNTSIDINGQIFAISGDVTIGTNSTISGDTPGSNLYFSGTTMQTIPDNFIDGDLDILTIENAQGVTSNTTIVLTSLLDVINGEFSTNDALTLACQFVPVRKTAQVGPVGGSITGKVTTEQCFPANRAYRLLTSSVTTTTTIRENWQENAANYQDNPRFGYGTHITGLFSTPNTANEGDDGINGFDYNPSGNPSMYTFDNTGRTWNRVTSTLGNLTAGHPYRLMIRGGRNIDVTLNSTLPTNTKLAATGNLVTGPVTGVSNINPNANVFSIFGNPYHAQVDMDAVLNGSANIKTNVFYVWDPVVNTNGAYVTIAKSGGNWTNSNSTTSDVDRYLQPMQSAFVVTDNLSSTPSLNFQESYKNVTPDQMISFSVNPENYIQLNLFSEVSYANDETTLDGMKIFFDENNKLSSEDDFMKLSNDDENMARFNEETYVSIEQRPYPASEETLPLFFNKYRHSNYVLELKIADDIDFKIYVKDAYLGELTEITPNDNAFSFTIDSSIPASEDSERFSLVLEPISLSTVDENLAELSLYPNPTQGSFKISGQALSQNSEIEIYNMIGQQVYRRNYSGQSNIEVTDFNAITGIYLVKVKTDQGEKTFKLIKE